MIFSLMPFEQDFNYFRSYVLILQYYGIFVDFRDFRVFVFGYRAQSKKPEITENLYFRVIFLKIYQICFCVCLSLFLLAEFVISLYNCYFHDFRDFRVFDLAIVLVDATKLRFGRY